MAPSSFITGRQAALESRHVKVEVRDGVIVSNLPIDPPILAENWILPGFVDLHVHGAAGHDFIDGDADAAREICRIHARGGTTALCATLLAEDIRRTTAALQTLSSLVGLPTGGARIMGIHLEGPFLNPRRAGAQAREFLRLPDRAMLEDLVAAAGGRLRTVTLAPELPGALELVEALVERGIHVSLGHSDATYEQAREAVERGASLVTHLYNAMSGLHHRDGGLAAAALDLPALAVELIVDGHHVSDSAVRLAWRCKRDIGQLLLITDCTAALAAAPERARLGNVAVSVVDGAVRLADGTLAGSCLTMADGLFRFARAVDAPLCSVLPAATRWPGRVLQATVSPVSATYGPAPREAGVLLAGDPADLAVVDSGGRVVETWVAGERVYAAGRA